MHSKDVIAYVGARTTRARNARGNGLNVFRLTPDLAWQHLQLLEMDNPSFLAFDRTGQFLHTVHGDSDRVTSFSVDETSGKLSFLSEQSTQGRNPVHLAFDPTNRFLVIANHVTSSVAVLPRLADGRLGEVCDLVPIVGEIGPHRTEQPFPKPHQVEFDPSGKWIAVPDKGIDKVLIYSLDVETGKLSLVSECACREGAGPRHIAFHPGGRLAYVINELDSTVTACRFDPETGHLGPIQVISALPASFTGNSRGAEIAVSDDGKLVYASNRGSDTIAVFSIGTGGLLHLTGSWATGGKTPRFFAILGAEVLLAANEDSDTITAFDVSRSNGSLQPRQEVLSIGSPVCILFKALLEPEPS